MTHEPRNPVLKWVAPAAICAVVAIAYWPTFSGDFLVDDRLLIEDNPFIRSIQPLGFYFTQEDGIVDRSLWPEGTHTGYYRPIVNITYSVDYLLWGMNPAGFRTTNLILHVLACLALYGLLKLLTNQFLASVAATLAFGIHPVMTEAVSVISNRNNMLVTLFALVSLYAFQRFQEKRNWYRLLISLIFYTAALFSKEFGVMILPILFLFHLLMVRKDHPNGSGLMVYAPFAALTAVYFLLRASAVGAFLGADGAGSTTALWERLFFSPYLVMFNLRLLSIPWRLHSFQITYPSRVFGPEAIAGIFGLLLASYLLWRWRRERMVVFSFLAFAIGVIPVLNIIHTASPTLISMRWLYFPSAFLALSLCRFIDKHVRGIVHWGLLGVIGAGLGTGTFHLNQHHWHDETAFYTREVLVFNNPYHALGLANIYHGDGRWDEAETLYLRAIDAYPDQPGNYVNYSAFLVNRKRPREALAVIDRAGHLFMSLRTRGELLNNKGMALMQLGECAAAQENFEAAVSLAPLNAAFTANLGGAYATCGQLDRAIQVLDAGMAMREASYPLVRNLLMACMEAENTACALKALARIPEDRRRADPAIQEAAARLDGLSE
jgi:hypothetical protein